MLAPPLAMVMGDSSLGGGAASPGLQWALFPCLCDSLQTGREWQKVQQIASFSGSAATIVAQPP
jgi:hypothetical protein